MEVYLNENNLNSTEEELISEASDINNVVDISTESISGSNELGSNESEINELLKHSANLY